jgi:hypothetical protein
MKRPLIGLLLLGTVPTFAASDLDETVQNLSVACNSKEVKSVLGEKVDKCIVKLQSKSPMAISALCTGRINNETDCKITLIGNQLKTKCNTSDRGVFYNNSELVSVEYFQPSFELRGRETTSGAYKRFNLERGNETVISTQSSLTQMTIFHEGLFETSKNQVNADVKVRTVSGLTSLSDLQCFLID